ncbi:hypothetical protein [Streptomyces sp. NPDC048392]|uniref:hypothetical protein n=1 Tax=Streptomyces sp. NPDC048392 TaxID=3365543 RepID=UPI003714A722
MVVHQPMGDGCRRVSLRDQPVGAARSLAEVLAVVRAVGIAPGADEAAASPLIEWRGAGVDVWA